MKSSLKVRAALAALALALLALSPLAAATSGSIQVTGAVTAVTEISLITTGSTTSFDLAATAVDTLIGTLRERSNGKNGYKVELSSANGWMFKSSDLAIQDTVPYTLKYGVSGSESALTLSSGTVTITSTTYRTPNAGVDKLLLLSYTGDFYEADTNYADTLTFTITAY